MFGFVSKKKLLKEMKMLKESGKKENNSVHYPSKDEKQKVWNVMMQGYEDGHDNFYNALHYTFFEKHKRK